MDPGDYYSLNDQPLFDGSTSYCEPSFHLVNHGLAGASGLEANLKALQKTGPMLGTSYGRKRRRKRSKRRRRKYGSKAPFKSGKLSTSVGPDIGLPLGAQSPVTIFDTFPDPLTQGAPLPRPYGPRDNLRLQSLYKIHGYGRVKRRRRFSKSKKRKFSRRKKKSARFSRRRRRRFSRRRKKRKSKKRRGRRFSATPGTSAWKKAAMPGNMFNAAGAKYANPGALKTAKGLFVSDVELTVPGLGNKQYLTPDLNQPFQFSDNQVNTPILPSFGRRRRRSFGKGQYGSGYLKAGPNTVAYQKPIPMYHAGGTTIDFATNQLYSPVGLINQVGKVQPDGMTPNAWLTRSVGIGDGLGNKYRFGRKKRKKSKKKLKSKYGSGVYTPNGWTEGSGHLTIKQPGPKTLPPKVKGSFVNYGKKRLKKRKSNLKTSFGGKTISLDSSGKISIS